MVNSVHPDCLCVVVDPVQQAVRSPACAVLAGQFSSERLADAPRFSGQVSERELDDCAHDSRWKLVEVTTCCVSDPGNVESTRVL